MNDSRMNFNDGTAGIRPLLFRTTDNLRMEGYVTALTQDGMSLSIVSAHDAVLDHYGKILMARLRKVAPNSQFEVYFPANSEALLSRFNEVLSSSSVQDAMHGKNQVAAPRFWVVNDAGALPDHEFQLLARLVQQFPGSNIRVILFMTAASQKQKLLDAFGRRILNWDIEPPTLDQTAALLELARAQGQEGMIRNLLKKLPLPVMAAASSVRAETMTALDPDTVIPDFLEPPKPSLWRSKSVRWTMTVLLLLTGSVGITFYRDLSLNMERLTSAFKSAPSTKAVTGVVAPPKAIDPKAPQAPAVLPVMTISFPDLPASAAAASAPAPVVEEAPEPVKEKTRQEIVDLPNEALAGQAWVKKMPSGTFLVQHITMATYQSAELWIKRHPNLKNARVVAAYTAGESLAKFVIVSGPFKSLVEATRFVQETDIPKSPWIRSARYLKEHFTPELAAAYAQRRKENKR